MGITDNLKEQHKEIFEMITRISSQLNSDHLSKDASQVYTLLLDLADSLNYHLTMEDHSFYPLLFNHPDKNIVAAATKYVDEVSGIKESFTEYMSRWNTADTIRENPDNFISESMDIFEAISNRIYKEDNVLYPLVDSI